jgi:hypothetical protein
MNKPQQKVTSTKPKSKVKTRKKVTKKQIQEEVSNSITPRNILFASITGLLLAIIIIISNHYDKKEDKQICYCENATAPIRSKSKFKDINSEQLAHAQTNGLKTIINDKKQFDSQIDSLIEEGILVRITPNKYYNIRRLTHSYPYLTPEAKDLLNLIGKRFHANLQAEGLPKYKFQISSLLRTIEFQRQLTRQNVNATYGISAHYYGTTFDIAYDKYDRRGKSHQDPKVEAVLEKTLRELREECRMMIIRESSNKCFHMTVVKLKNDE